jgi:ABC-type bacteriocin/lantibiotic exporter with double-glycine peptidase domain
MTLLDFIPGIASIKKYLIIIVATIAVVYVAGTVYYFHYSQDQIQTLNDKNAKLDDAVKTQTQTITDLQNDALKAAQVNNNVNKTFTQQRKYVDDVRKSIDIKDENSVNTTMKSTLNCISLITGATAKDLGMADDEFTKFKTTCN